MGPLPWRALLSATSEADGEADGEGCSLTRLFEAYRRGDIIPEPTEPERMAIRLHIVPTVNALIAEALGRSGATRDDIRQERIRRRA